jgi:hypothetical protein
MQLSRTILIAAALLLLLAIIGWAEFTRRIDNLTGDRERLAGRLAELEQTLAAERAAEGDLASLRQRIETATNSLNQRMETLGAREHELAEVEATLDQSQQRLAALEDQQATAKQRLTARLAVLGERERDLSQAERALSQASASQQALATSLEQLDREVAEKRAELGALNMELGTLERERSQRATDLAGLQAELKAAQTLLSENQGQLDAASLAKSVAELQARKEDLQAKLAALEAAEAGVLASRLFAGPSQYPPESFAAYGILAFRSRASPQDRARHLMICEAYVTGLPHVSELDVDISDQMATVWPVDSDLASDKLNRMPRKGICEVAVDSYGLATARQALKDAYLAGMDASGIGPFLLAWSPSIGKGKRGALVLGADMSDVTTAGHAQEFLKEWSHDIEQDPLVWRKGWNRGRTSLKIRLWVDKYGPKILTLFGAEE